MHLLLHQKQFLSCISSVVICGLKSLKWTVILFRAVETFHNYFVRCMTTHSLPDRVKTEEYPKRTAFVVAITKILNSLEISSDPNLTCQTFFLLALLMAEV